MEDGSAWLHLGKDSDGLAGRLLALVLHFYSRNPRATTRAAKLPPRLEARPVNRPTIPILLDLSPSLGVEFWLSSLDG